MGTEWADMERVPCWVKVSPAACTLYTRAGLRVVGFTDYELDECAPGGKGAKKGWGMFMSLYMKRVAIDAQLQRKLVVVTYLNLECRERLAPNAKSTSR